MAETPASSAADGDAIGVARMDAPPDGALPGYDDDVARASVIAADAFMHMRNDEVDLGTGAQDFAEEESLSVSKFLDALQPLAALNGVRLPDANTDLVKEQIADELREFMTAQREYAAEKKRDMLSGKTAMVEMGIEDYEPSDAYKRCERSIFKYAFMGAQLPTGINLPCYAEQIAEILYPEVIEQKKRQLDADSARRKEKQGNRAKIAAETPETKSATMALPKGKTPSVVEVKIRGQNYRQLALQSRKATVKPKEAAQLEALLPEDSNVRDQLILEDKQLQVAIRNLKMHQYAVRKLEREIAALEKERGNLVEMQTKQIHGTQARLKRFSKVKKDLQEGLSEREEQRRLKEEAAAREAEEKAAAKRAWRERGAALKQQVDEWLMLSSKAAPELLSKGFPLSASRHRRCRFPGRSRASLSV